MNEVLIILGLILVVVIGYSIIFICNFLKEMSLFEKSPYAFALGVGAVAFEMFLYSIFKIPWNPAYLLTPIVLIVIAAFKMMPKIRFKHKLFTNWSLIEKVILVLILLLIFFVAFEAQLRPVSAWDGWAIWLLKAKMFYIDGFVNPAVYKLLKEGYPFVINLSVAFLYTLLGKVDDRSVLLLFFCFYLFTSILFYTQVKKRTGNLFALVFTFLLISTQNLVRHGGRFEAGYADLALGFYFFVSLSLFLRFLKSWSNRDLIILSVILGITGLIKEEGISYILLISLFLVYSILKSKKYKMIPLSFIYLIPIGIWQMFKLYFGPFPGLYNSFVPHLNRTISIIYFILKEMINFQNWNLLWILFFIAFFTFNLSKKYFYIYCLIFFQLFIYSCVFLISPYPPNVHIPNVMDRLLLHLAPISVFVTALVLYKPLKILLRNINAKIKI